MIRTLAIAALALLLATPALAGDGHLRHRRSDTGRYLSSQGIVGGRSVSSDYYAPRYYGRGYRSHRYSRPTERIIIIERDYSPRRWR